MTALHPLAEAMLTTWFGEDESEEAILRIAARWWTRDASFDDQLRQRFGAHLARAAAGAFHDWEATPRGALALVILLDQVSRNIHRGDARSFSQDPAAREVTRRALAVGHDRRLNIPMRTFFYMPLMHSEHLADHADALALFEDLVSAARGGPCEDMARSNLDYQRKHTAWLEPAGRYAHRNEVLGRVSTPAERAFLAEFNAPQS